MAANVVRGLRKPVFVKVESLKPETSGHTLAVKVVSSTTVLRKGAAASPHLRNTCIAECLVGDDTASILFTARNDQGACACVCVCVCDFVPNVGAKTAVRR